MMKVSKRFTKKYAKKNVTSYKKGSFARRNYNKVQHSGELSIRCESDVFVQASSAVAGYFLGGVTNTFMNLTTILQSSLTWTNMSPLYSKFKITSLTITVLSQGVNYLYNSTVATPVFYVGFIPDKVSTTLGTAIQSSDSSLLVMPSHADGGNTKTYYFPNNYFPGPGIGLGVWNNPANVSSLLGQLGVYTNTTSVASANYTPYQIICRLNVVFDQLNK